MFGGVNSNLVNKQKKEYKRRLEWEKIFNGNVGSNNRSKLNWLWKNDGKPDNVTTTITSVDQTVNESTEIKKDETKNDTSDWIRYSIDPKGSVRCPKYFSSRVNAPTHVPTNTPKNLL